MADPLSIAASVITLAAVAAQISKAISRLRHFGEVPGRVYTLKNEISDLEVVLRQVAHALEQKSLAPNNEQGSLEQILARTKGHLADLGKALERVANACAGGKVKIISKSAIWWKEKTLFQGLQEDIRSVKATLNLMLGVANSQDLHHVILELRRVTVQTSTAEQTHQSIKQGPNDHHLALSTRMDRQYQEMSDRLDEGGEGDWVEEQNFPLVHRIILGLSSKSLAAELEENPNAVYVTDAQNRTALDWATARIQLEDMSLLLRYGADPNNMDITGRTPVLHAVDSHNISCLRLVLEAGGHPDPPMPNGMFRSSPLTAAGRAGMPEMLKRLLDFEANPNASNPEGLTALHSVARTENVDCALLLLEYGADLNAISSNGKTPLTTAIIYNNHPVLRLFVDCCYEYITTIRLNGPPPLSIIAEHADLETINILASSHPLKVSSDLSVEGIAANREVLQQRGDYSEKLSEAFEELITIVKAEEYESQSIESLTEAGLFLSARSSFHSELAEAMEKLDFAVVSPTDSDRRSDKFEDTEENLISF
ncbi:MAG: hypothetical protein Q9225_006643 [Loekoesia sp. 1 TL-2023]